jgi:hypothetical protein
MICHHWRIIPGSTDLLEALLLMALPSLHLEQVTAHTMQLLLVITGFFIIGRFRGYLLLLVMANMEYCTMQQQLSIQKVM